MPVYHNKMINRMLDMLAWPLWGEPSPSRGRPHPSRPAPLHPKKMSPPMDTFVPPGKKKSVHLSHDLICSVFYT